MLVFKRLLREEEVDVSFFWHGQRNWVSKINWHIFKLLLYFRMRRSLFQDEKLYSEFDSDFLKSKQSVQMTQKVCKFSLTNVQLTPRRYLWQMQNSNQNENLKFHISCPENFSQNQNEYSKNLKCCSWTNVAKWKVKVLHFKVNWKANFVVWAWWLGSWAPI